MKCPICGWANGFYHAAMHTLVDRRMYEGAMPGPPSGPWRPIPTSRELFALVGFCLELGEPFEGTIDMEGQP